MDDYLEIDLRSLVKNILKNWIWIVLPAVIIGLGVFIYTYTRLSRFKAQANFILSDPTYQVNLASGITTNSPILPSKEALTTLLLNDEIVAALFDLWDCDPDVKESCSLKKFKENNLNVNVGPNNMLVTLSVQGESRQNTALLANTWANLAIENINMIFFGLDEGQKTFFAEQVVGAKLAMDQAEADLVVFAKGDPRVGLSNQLETLIATQRESLYQIRSLVTAKQDLLDLVAQLDAEPANDPLDPSYRLSLTLLQTRIYSGLNWESSPIQVLVDLTDLSDTKTVGGFKAMLENMLDQIDLRIENLDQEQVSLTPQISALQAEIQIIDNEEQTLKMEYNRLKKNYELMAVKLDEVNITLAGNSDSGAIIISLASIPNPDDRLPRNTVRNTAIGALAGGFLGLAGVVIADWWKAEDKLEAD
jgi:hypothetical protein